MNGRTITILHLAEEVKAGFRRRLPIGEMPWLVFVGLSVVVYIVCFATLALFLRISQWAVPLAQLVCITLVGGKR